MYNIQYVIQTKKYLLYQYEKYTNIIIAAHHNARVIILMCTKQLILN